MTFEVQFPNYVTNLDYIEGPFRRVCQAISFAARLGDTYDLHAETCVVLQEKDDESPSDEEDYKTWARYRARDRAYDESRTRRRHNAKLHQLHAEPKAQERSSHPMVRRDIAKVIEKLPDDQREVILLLFDMQLTLEEAAAEMEVSKSTVQRLQKKAKATLARLLAAYHETTDR